MRRIVEMEKYRKRVYFIFNRSMKSIRSSFDLWTTTTFLASIFLYIILCCTSEQDLKESNLDKELTPSMELKLHSEDSQINIVDKDTIQSRMTQKSIVSHKN